MGVVVAIDELVGVVVVETPATLVSVDAATADVLATSVFVDEATGGALAVVEATGGVPAVLAEVALGGFFFFIMYPKPNKLPCDFIFISLWENIGV